ncbi:MAG TPA: universal stress protein [Candidatus Limnocylindrales bacterium]|nr:universal stress protein [Candidatus Limnocylindrales bacterium]
MKILLAIDGSACSIVARDLVGSLRWPPATEVVLLGAYDVPIDWTGGVGSTMDWVGDIEDATREVLEQQLDELAVPLAEAGLATTRLVVKGRTASVIVDVAREQRADLVVTGSRGRGPLRSMLLGSVAAEVAGDAPCPVLVARSPAVSRLLVATDGSPAALAIPDRLAAWGVFAGQPAEAVAVSIPDGPIFETAVSLYTLGDKRLASRRQELRATYERDAEEMAARLTESGMPAVAHLRAGDPAHEILAVAEERGADLIVTGTRGLGGIDRLLLGSVARNVLTHARCSVLVMREPIEGRELVPTGGTTHASQ